MDLKVAQDIPPRVPTKEYPSVLNDNFPSMKNSGLIEASFRKPVDRVPVWVMRQAGRYLPEFLEVKKSHDFFEICTTPSLACEVTLQPLRRFDLDSAIIFSDILVVPQFMGLEVQMLAGKGPTFPSPLVSPEDLSRLVMPDPLTAFEKYLDSLYLTRHSLQGHVPIIGFTGGPFTLFTYMIEGGSSNAFTKSRKWLFAYPEESKRLLDMITEVVCQFLIAQISAGAQILQVFESHAGLLGKKDFLEFIWPYLDRISRVLKEKFKEYPRLEVPLIVFPKDAGFVLEEFMKTQFDVVGVDWTVDLQSAMELAGRYGKAIQGNLDPALLYASDENLRERALEMARIGGKNGYIANLGHGIYPDCSPDKLAIFIDAVHSI
jgi:uroporphyrinogen decarboxylase